MAGITIGNVVAVTAQAIEGGFLLTTSDAIEERLTTPGVDGTRWRTQFLQLPPATIMTVSDAADFASAIGLCNSYHSYTGTLTNVTWQNIQYKNVHVAKVEAVPVMGSLNGGGAGGTAHVRATWILEATDFTDDQHA